MKIKQLVPSVRLEVEKPFEKKLERAKELARIFIGLAQEKSCVSCSFGKDSMVVLWLCRQELPEIPVIFNNTLVQYKETYEFRDRMKEEWNLNLIETRPSKTFWEIAKEKGLPDGSKKGTDSCCYYLKDKPFVEVVKKHGFKINFTGTTALESRLRMWVACQRGLFYYNRKQNITRINPIVFWTPEEVLNFTTRVQIPVNPAYEKFGIDRLGCVPCTSHKFWRKQLAKTNPKMYEFIQKRYFHQRLLK